MKKQQNTCRTCKWLEDLPFTDTYTCMNEYSSYDTCDCDPDRDVCEEWEGKNNGTDT